MKSITVMKRLSPQGYSWSFIYLDMRKTPILLSIISILGCNANSAKNSKANDSIPSDTIRKEAMIDSAKRMLDSANFYMEKGVKKELSVEVTRKKIHPFMDSFQKIYKKLPPADTAIVYQYRIDGINKLIDLQIAESKK